VLSDVLRVYPEAQTEHTVAELHLVHYFGQAVQVDYKTLLAVVLVELVVVVVVLEAATADEAKA
jgi:hypothetical protein